MNSHTKIWVCTSSEETVKGRLAQRGLSDAEVQKRMAAQMPTAKRVLRATRLLANDSSLADFTATLSRAWDAMLAMRA
jgi:dephospho-CoA kinase